MNKNRVQLELASSLSYSWAPLHVGNDKIELNRESYEYFSTTNYIAVNTR